MVQLIDFAKWIGPANLPHKVDWPEARFKVDWSWSGSVVKCLDLDWICIQVWCEKALRLASHSKWSVWSGFSQTIISQGKNKIPFHKKQVVNNSTRLENNGLPTHEKYFMPDKAFYGAKLSNKQNAKVICRFHGLRTAHSESQKAIWAMENVLAAHVAIWLYSAQNWPYSLASCKDLAMLVDNSLDSN